MKELILGILFLLLLILGLFLIYLRLKTYLETKILNQFLSLNERMQDIIEIRKELQRLYHAEELLNFLKAEILELSRIFIGRKSGVAAERGLEELLSVFPSHLLRRDLKLANGEVEFALSLSGERFIPIDSKFLSPDLLRKESLSPSDVRELLKRIRERAKEVGTYLKDERTIGFAIMTCPDGLFPYLQRRVLEDLERDGICLVPYSLLIPLLLYLHFFWERFGKFHSTYLTQEGLAKIEKYLLEIEDALDKIPKELKTIENLLFKLRETQRYLKREWDILKRESQRVSKSRDTLE